MLQFDCSQPLHQAVSEQLQCACLGGAVPQLREGLQLSTGVDKPQ